jgi:hypothetical protein
MLTKVVVHYLLVYWLLTHLAGGESVEEILFIGHNE